MTLAVAVLPAYLRTPRDGRRALPGHAAADPRTDPPADPSACRRAAPSRPGPRRRVPVFFVTKHLARREHRRGQRAPDRWRIPTPPPGDAAAS